MIWCGSRSMSMWSLNVAGSLSSPLTTRYLVGACRSIDHLRPAGKPAPPRPSRLALLTSAATSAGRHRQRLSEALVATGGQVPLERERVGDGPSAT